ncbi:hypothetical protein [Demequina sp.]|uniref:LppM family (lipo)protein n=1 Tax=Demequina sp. TaxID=2050685 RepID=UPI0025F827B9|nr:hypothetical protein [Demequina sp.]
MRRSGVAIAALVLALTGCVRVSAESTLGPDDTFSQHAIVAMTNQARNAIESQLDQVELPEGVDTPDVPLDVGALLDPDTVREQLAPLEEAEPGSVTVQAYSDDEGRNGVEIDIVDVPLDTVADAAGALPVGGASAIARDGDTYVVTIETGAASQLQAAGGGIGDLSLLEGAVDVAVAFTFPGLVREASAGTIEGTTVTLGLSDLLGSDSIRIVGGADREIDWGPLLKWGLVTLAGLLVVGGGAALVIQDRRRRARTALPPPRADGGGGVGMLGARDDAPAAAPDDAPAAPRTAGEEP